MKRKREMGLRVLIPAALILALALAMPLGLGAGAIAAGSEARYPQSVTVQLRFPELEVIDNGDGTQALLMEGYPSAREAGLPAIPSRTLSIALPPGTQASGVAVEEETWQALPGSYAVEWGQIALPSDAEPGREPVPPVSADQEVYTSDQAYPEAAVLLQGSGRMRAVSIADVEINPVMYYPHSGRIEVCTSMTIRVDTESAAAPSPQELAAPPSDDALADTLENFEQAKLWYERALQENGGKLDASEEGDTADYLIITPEAMVDAVEPLKTYKEYQGLSEQVVTAEWIYVNYEGSWSQRIRQFLKENYASLGTDYVLLAGTHAAMPMQECYVEVLALTPPFVEGKLIPTDYYYSDLSGDWDLNDDGKFGQPGIDDQEGGVDYYPEVYVGRIPVDDAAQMTAICQKIVAFSEDTGTWKRKALLLGGVANYTLDPDGILPMYGSQLEEKIKNDVLTPQGYATTTMYETEGLAPDPVPCDIPLNKENVLAEWPNGYGVVSIHAHGNATSVARKIWYYDNGNGLPEVYEMSWPYFLHVAYIGDLDDSHPSVVFSVGCSNAEPTFSDNLMAALLKHGASATVGSSKISYYTPGWVNEYMGLSPSLNYMFLRYLVVDGYSVGKALRMADVWCKTNCDWTGGFNRANLYNFDLFGDPSMTLYAPGELFIAGVSPGSAWNTWPVTLTVKGYGFLEGAAATLRMEGQDDIVATQVEVDSPTLMHCTFDITWAAPGKWDLVVENPDGKEAVLEDGFSVTTLCGAGGGTAAMMLGLAMGLLWITGSGGLIKRRKAKRRQ